MENIHADFITKSLTDMISDCLDVWNRTNAISDSHLARLFNHTYPSNTSEYEIFVKVCSLNTVYNTNIYYPADVAKRIFDLQIDSKINAGDLEIVNEIAKVEIHDGKRPKPINYYSFATKYCSFHKPDFYPIYDSLVEKSLIYFSNSDFKYDKTEAKKYMIFRKKIDDFKSKYNLENYTYKEIDIFLWLLGKTLNKDKINRQNVIGMNSAGI